MTTTAMKKAKNPNMKPKQHIQVSLQGQLSFYKAQIKFNTGNRVKPFKFL